MYGERLKSLRKQKGLTAEQVAEMLQMGRSTYAGYEKEYRKPPLDVLVTLAKFFNTSTDYILGLTDNKQSIKDENNFYKYLEEKELNWKGVPLTDEELKPIKDLMEIVVRDRLPYKKD